MKATSTAILTFSALFSIAISTPVSPVLARYNHIQLVQRTSTNSTAPPPAAGTSVVVKEGDTLSTIAAMTGVGICDIAKANNIANPNLILAGATLQIPASTGTKDDTSCLPAA